VVATRE
jgi:hypothetical protein